LERNSSAKTPKVTIGVDNCELENAEEGDPKKMPHEFIIKLFKAYVASNKKKLAAYKVLYILNYRSHLNQHWYQLRQSSLGQLSSIKQNSIQSRLRITEGSVPNPQQKNNKNDHQDFPIFHRMFHTALDGCTSPCTRSQTIHYREGHCQTRSPLLHCFPFWNWRTILCQWYALQKKHYWRTTRFTTHSDHYSSGFGQLFANK